MRLRDRLMLEKENATKLKGVFLSKEWEYCKYNNEFHKGTKVAYFYGEFIVFHFTIFQNLKTHHKIQLQWKKLKTY